MAETAVRYFSMEYALKKKPDCPCYLVELEVIERTHDGYCSEYMGASIDEFEATKKIIQVYVEKPIKFEFEWDEPSHCDGSCVCEMTDHYKIIKIESCN